MDKEKGEKDMFAEAPIKKNVVKKPIIKKSKFANMTNKDWQESNQSSKENRGISIIKYSDLFGGK